MNGVEFIVYGTPAPQGSKKPYGNGRVEASKLVKPWREAVKWAWIEMRNSGIVEPIMGPVIVDTMFYFQRPKKPKYEFPCVKDVDKLLRSTNDALTQCGAIEDDRFIVVGSFGKVYAGSLPYGLQQPGATIKIRRAG